MERTTASADELRALSEYLSTISVADVDVVVVDGSPREVFEEHRRILCWVSRHVAARQQHRTATGLLDPIRAAVDVAACEKVIVATEEVRYTAPELDSLCDLLEMHEVVEPQDYLDPLPWWGSIEAGRMLVHRSIEPHPDHGATFGFRRSAVRGLRTLDLSEAGDDHVRRLAENGAEVYPAYDVFVRRRPPQFEDWLRNRPRQAYDDFVLPFKTAFFFALVPIAILFAFAGGLRAASSYTGVIAFATMALALRGRAGAGAFFPLRAIFGAPLWVLERSLSVYWALYRKLRGAQEEPGRVVAAPARGTKVASGE